MVNYLPGDRVRAAGLRDALPAYGVLGSAAAVSSSDILSDSAGLYVPVEANTAYALEGYIAYRAETTSTAVSMGFTSPPGSSGTWGLLCPSGDGGGLNGFAATSYDIGKDPAGLNFAFAPAIGQDLVCEPHGFLKTGGAAGVLRFRFGQLDADPTTTVIRAGSWLRLTRLD